ncbi:MAG: DUF2779 domain-containing protein, partial [Campylobacterales bacterium]|nr:DUF2779 domain-containing protein [Campylobacterales bacterium]
YYDGILKIEDIPNDIPFTKNASFQIKHHKSQQTYIDKIAIKEFIKSVKYPINFFDFETFQNSIPRFKYQKPFEQIPFQYSLHILHEDGTIIHKEFLGDEFSDPRVELIFQMVEDITKSGTIMAFNQSFEKTQIKNLANYFKKLVEHSNFRFEGKLNMSDELLRLLDRFIDLAYPFQSKAYYHPNFHGGYSIKTILPVLFPEDKELDYKNLNIQHGGIAMESFSNLYLIDDKSKREKIKNDLLEYCKLDTWAMVKIWEFLNKAIEK